MSGAEQERFRQDAVGGPLKKVARASQFWARAVGIYSCYKVRQLQALVLRTQGWDSERLKKELWLPHHEWAGVELHQLCVDLRGFYLKVGQFLGARRDFIPEPLCRHLSKLHDQVPPMHPQKTRRIIEQELGGTKLEDVFEWIDLDEPLGSASISQVHKAKLRGGRRPGGQRAQWETAAKESQQPYLSGAALAAEQACKAKGGPNNGLVAVKVQYPDELKTMVNDLESVRLAAYYLSKTEIQFDLPSAVSELAKQIRLEFDFEREARVMDAVAEDLKPMWRRAEVPRSVPGLVTRRMLVMNFLDGVQITRAGSRLARLSERQRLIAKRRLLANISEAYGRMMLKSGLFQADCHPGNILVMKGAKVGLLDYGQSKQLPTDKRLAFARLILALSSGNKRDMVARQRELGVVTSVDDLELVSRTAVGMFDTRGRVNPFDPNSPIKKCGIKQFPPDMFFVLRVVQLLRGLATGMGIQDFSSAQQWKPFAKAALRVKQQPVPVLLQ